ncbi:MAG: putative Ig domain-containing protein, partial [Synergistaceae bacterium]|nr:putative Ig domain-containing protein [Synergistaceae bacterium]
TEVGFYTTDNNQKYEIRVYTGLGTSMPSSSPINGSPVATKSGTMAYAGYHTITLDSPVSLTKNNYFSVVVIHKNTKMSPTESTNSTMTPNAAIESGSFFSYNGSYWETSSTSNACIKAFTITGASTGTAPTILTAYPNDGIINTGYYYAFSASGSTPITWSASGNVPSGLSMSTSGVLSGTPTSTGSFTFTVTARNDYGSDSRNYTMNIQDLPSITPSSFTGYVKTSFNQTMSLSYGSSSNWSASDLPSGLSIKAKTGVISGKPKETGTFRATISAVTSAGTSTASVTFTILPQPSKPKFETTTLPDAVIGQSYSQTVSITGTAPITVSVTGLPDGLSFNASTGRISGTPTTEGKYTLKFEATNAATSSPVKKNIKLTVTAAPPRISVPTLAMGYVGVVYDSVQFSLSSGNGAITWSASGAPSGISVSKTGLLSGTPKKGGNFTIKLTAKNSGGTDTREIPFTVALLPTIKTTKISDATTDKAYSAKLTATGSAPITWNIEGLPSTLRVTTEKNGEIAYITGTPTEAGTYALSVTARNSVGTATSSISLTVKGVAPKITAKLEKGTVGSSYNGSTITATGTKPITFTYAIDASQQKKHGISSLEELGLSFTSNASTGTASITGTPTKSVKSLQVTLTATNSVKSVTKKVTLNVSGTAPSFSVPNDNGNYTQSVNSSVNINFTVTGTRDITFSMSKVAGFTLTQTGDYTATLTGTTPAKAKKLSFTITAKNNDGKATKKITIQTVENTTSATENVINDNSGYELYEDILSKQDILVNDKVNEPSSSEPDTETLTEQGTSEPVITFGAERDLSQNEREKLITEGYIVAEILPELTVNESGIYDIDFELDESVPVGAKLFWFANSSQPSSDDEFAEFYDDTGAEIEEVPENHIITVAVWLNKGVNYSPVIAVK